MTRNGKIARLPRATREELNRRLDDGQMAATILRWLNKDMVVQDILLRQFSGAPVSKQNLSEWRQGGHQDWLRHRQTCELVRQMKEQADNLEEETGGEAVSDQLATVLAAELARTAKELMKETTDPAERWERLQELLGQLTRLRREDHQAMRLREAKRQQDIKEERQEVEDSKLKKKEEKKKLLAPLLAVMRQKALTGMFGGGKAGEGIARYFTAVEYDLPFEQEDLAAELEQSEMPGAAEAAKASKEPPEGGESKPVKPSQSESNQLRMEGGSPSPGKGEAPNAP